MTRLRLGHQRPLNRRCPDEKYPYVNNNRLTEYPGTPAWTPASLGTAQLDTRDLLVAGVQAGVPGYSVNLLLFTYGYFSSGHLRFSGRWCPNLNLVKISLSLSRALRIHVSNELECRLYFEMYRRCEMGILVSYIGYIINS